MAINDLGGGGQRKLKKRNPKLSALALDNLSNDPRVSGETL